MTPRHALPWLAGFAALLLTAGCGYQRTVESQPVSRPANDDTGDPGGLVYALPRSLITVRGEVKDGAVTYTVATSLVADPAARFRLRHRASGMTDDKLDFAVGTNGLLTSTNTRISERTGEVLVQLSRSAGALAGSGIMSLQPERTAPSRPSAYPFATVLTVAELAGPGGALLPDGGRIELVEPQPGLAAQPGAAAADCPFSVCYRTVVPVLARIVAPGARPERANRFSLAVVDPRSLEGFDFRAAPLVARTANVSFENGLLTGTSIELPSTAVAAASVPYNVIRAGLSAFGEILTVRVNNTTSEANLVAAQTSIINNLRTQLEAQRRLDDARSSGGPAVIGP